MCSEPLVPGGFGLSLEPAWNPVVANLPRTSAAIFHLFGPKDNESSVKHKVPKQAVNVFAAPGCWQNCVLLMLQPGNAAAPPRPSTLRFTRDANVQGAKAFKGYHDSRLGALHCRDAASGRWFATPKTSV